jgi:hypothetical protein
MPSDSSFYELRKGIKKPTHYEDVPVTQLTQTYSKLAAKMHAIIIL